jgi:glycosyltransferase involved in cell wall biosynthesis
MGPETKAAAAPPAEPAPKHVDIIVGIPSYNNARTIAHVVRAANAGLAKYFPDCTSLIVNSDGGSKDGTREAVLSSQVDDMHLLLVSHPVTPVQRLSVPYDGVPGKGSAFRLIFEMAQKLEAKACCVVDSDLRSITPEWIDLLVRPVLSFGYDFVAPYYYRHKYDGTITNSIIYPLTRALYGKRVRQPIGGDFGMSAALIARYLEKKDDWETDVARFGIDIWMTTLAITEGFRICQSFLGAKLHDAKDPGLDLSAMLEQVVGSVFMLMRKYEILWQQQTESKDVDLFGFRFDVGLDPIEVNVERMIGRFQTACQELGDVWSHALTAETRAAVMKLADRSSGAPFHMDDGLWVRVIYDFAAAYNRGSVDRSHLLRSLTPLYMARVASFVVETRPLSSQQVEEKIEQLCRSYEELKPYLTAHWNDSGGADTGEEELMPVPRDTRVEEARYA